MEVLSGLFPYPVQVISGQISSIITIEDSIYIDHGQNVIMKRPLCIVILVVLKQELNDSLQNE